MGETKVFVGNVNFNATREELSDFFHECRAIREVAIILDRDTKRSKGYAFIIFDNVDEAQDAVKRMDGQDFQGRPLKVKLADNQDNNRSFKDFDSGREKYEAYGRSGRGGGYGDSWSGGYPNSYRPPPDYGSGYGYAPERGGGYGYGYHGYERGDYHGSSGGGGGYYRSNDRHNYSSNNGYNYY